MPILPETPQVIKVLQIDRLRAFRAMTRLTPQCIQSLQGSASVLRYLIKINGIMPSHTKRQLSVGKKGTFV